MKKAYICPESREIQSPLVSDTGLKKNFQFKDEFIESAILLLIFEK